VNTSAESYADITGGVQYLDQIPSTSTWTLGTGFSFNTATGVYTVTGSANAIANGGGYEGSMHDYTVTVDPGDPNWYDVEDREHTATPDSYSYSKGETQYADVTSENPSEYPSNGTPDNTYWYVSK